MTKEEAKENGVLVEYNKAIGEVEKEKEEKEKKGKKEEKKPQTQKRDREVEPSGFDPNDEDAVEFGTSIPPDGAGKKKRGAIDAPGDDGNFQPGFPFSKQSTYATPGMAKERMEKTVLDPDRAHFAQLPPVSKRIKLAQMMMGMTKLASILLDDVEGMEAALGIAKADINKLEEEKAEMSSDIEWPKKIFEEAEVRQKALEEVREKSKVWEEKFVKQHKAWEDLRKKLSVAVDKWGLCKKELEMAKVKLAKQSQEKDSMAMKICLASGDAFEQGYLAASSSPQAAKSCPNPLTVMDIMRTTAIVQGQAFKSMIPYSLQAEAEQEEEGDEEGDKEEEQQKREGEERKDGEREGDGGGNGDENGNDGEREGDEERDEERERTPSA